MKKPDIKAVNSGGRGFGKLDKSDLDFLKPNADTDLLYGKEKYVGYYNKVSDTPGRSDDE
jgi:hypothetical protein